MSTSLGHYGMPALVVAACALVGLIVHLTVPYGLTWDNGDTQVDKRSEISDGEEQAGDAWVASAGPTITLVACILALASSVILLIVGFLPMPTEGARWVGWLLAAVALVGGALMFASSMYFVGGWMTALLNLNGAGDADFTMTLSPLIVAILGAVACGAALKVQRNVMPAPAREPAARDHTVALWGLAFLGLVLLVPWSMTTQGDGVTWSSTMEILTFNSFSNENSFFGSTEVWDGMAYSLNVMLATGWIVFASAVLIAVRGLLNGTEAAPIGRILPVLAFAGLFMALWSLVMYILAWSVYFKPTSGADDMQPGYFPILVLAAFVPMTLKLIGLARDTITDLRPGGTAGAGTRKIGFD